MDPVSLSTACVGLITAISQLSVQITGFVSSVRDARKDMDAVSRELISLTLCLEALRDDSQKIHFPETLLGIFGSCDRITKQMQELLTKLSSGDVVARLRWTVAARDEMNKLRSSLESHKSALDIALDMASL
jgi:hypothetical protein